ncbi:MAG: hypothetical protein SFY70_03545 [Bacteroidia bacterium]|nr:hypothetical protein [Bacteroidia bacterium]
MNLAKRPHLYPALLEALEAERGRNRFRGRIVQARKGLVLEVGLRGTPDWRHVWLWVDEADAGYHCRGASYRCSAFATVADFVAVLVDLCRSGAPYTETYPDRTQYKH